MILRQTIIFLSICCALICRPDGRMDGYTKDSLIRELQRTIDNRGTYLQQKEERIEACRQQLREAVDDQARFSAMGHLFDEFITFNTDSAMAYSAARERLAMATGNDEHLRNARLNRANVLAHTGMYIEALAITDTISPTSLPDYLRPYYFYIVKTVYTNLADYSLQPEDKARYLAKSYELQDTLIALSSPQSLSWVVNYAASCNNRGDYKTAVATLEDWIANHDLSLHDHAICANILAWSYRRLGNDQKAIENLLVSSIADLQSATREYVSLRQLGIFLYHNGDIEHAYEYLRISMEDAQKCNARLRMLEINDMLPIVNEAFIRSIQEQKKRQFILIVCVCLLAIILSLAVWKTRKQMKKTKAANLETKAANERLRELNEELKEYNTKLSEANHAIAENAQIKEEYIARFMNQCSHYISQTDTFRKSLNKLLALGKTDQLRDTLKSTDITDLALKEFYQNFDSAFLKLFPTFVEEFNQLLVESGRIELKKDGELTTELRVYALIRLGISDSMKIAEFLRYSVTTIYNCRTKARNKAVGDRGSFEARVMEIGRHKI